jgi:hypothetical protein
MKKKRIVGIGSKIVVVTPSVNYFCKVYKIEKPEIQGVKFDFIVVDEGVN